MRPVLHFLATCAVSTGALLSATRAPDPWPYFAVILGAWLLFLWRLSVRLNRP